MKSALERVGRLPYVAVLASLLGVGALAVAQPMLDLLGRNPEFFIARRFPVPDIVLLALALVVGPLVLFVPVWLGRRAGPAVGAVTHLLALTILTGLAAAAALVTAGAAGTAPALFIGVVALAGIGVALLYLFSPGVRTGASFLGLAPLIVLGWFAFATPTSDVLFASQADLPEAVRVGSPYPLVLIVYDEFPAASLMLEDGSLDGEHYPHFGRLARDGVWYRNAVGVRQQTEEAVPALLTGRDVSEGSIPVTSNHPFTLFSLLSAEYDIEAVENVTELCPTFICGNVSRPVDPPAQRWEAVLSDLAVVYGHMVMPTELAQTLPPVDQGWGGFGVGADGDEFDIIERFVDEVSRDRRRDLTRFVASLRGMESESSLRYAHFLYPHHPWDVTADGRLHGAPRPPGRDGVGWGPDPFLVAQGWQRHLIQTQWADTMLGRVLDELEEMGIYENAMVVVVADHGITIRPGIEHQRTVTDATRGSIAFVPLFVKYPRDFEAAPTGGEVDDVRAETVDVLPTIAEVLDVTVPWAVDGVSLLDEPRRAQRGATVMTGTAGAIGIPTGLEDVIGVVEEKIEWFPDGDPFALAPRSWEGLMGREGLAQVDEAELDVAIDQAEALADYQPGSDPIPAYLSGTVIAGSAPSGEEIIAVTADETVVAVTTPYEVEGGSARWEAMIAPAILDAGPPSIEAWIVRGSSDDPVLYR